MAILELTLLFSEQKFFTMARKFVPENFIEKNTKTQNCKDYSMRKEY